MPYVSNSQTAIYFFIYYNFTVAGKNANKHTENSYYSSNNTGEHPNKEIKVCEAFAETEVIKAECGGFWHLGRTSL